MASGGIATPVDAARTGANKNVVAAKATAANSIFTQ
jgi:hypothetical protein